MRWIIPYVIIAAVGLYAGHQWRQPAVDALEAEVASQARSIAALKQSRTLSDEARRVEAARAARAADLADIRAAQIETLLATDLGECADAPLDSHTVDLLRGLHP